MTTRKLGKKASAALILALRWFFKNAVTAKFISGDGLASLADIQLYPPAKRKNEISKLNPIESARIIFCPSHEIDRMFEEYQNEIKAEILIFGNSDHDFLTFKWTIPSTVKRIYLQNSFISNDFFRTLPIGLENLRYGKNGFSIYFPNFLSKFPKRNQVLVGPFSDTHSERVSLKNLQGKNFRIQNKRISPLRLGFRIARTKYVAVPRGNGVDTHRLWEVLYRGSVPIMLRNSWSESLLNFNLPIILIEEWSNENVLEAIDRYQFKRINPKEIPILWITYWRSELDANES